jgi:hypothetical protein
VRKSTATLPKRCNGTVAVAAAWRALHH